MFNQMIQGLMAGNNPMMGLFNQMMKGKTPRQQIQTLIQRAKAQGFDINKKQFTADDIRRLGL